MQTKAKPSKFRRFVWKPIQVLIFIGLLLGVFGLSAFFVWAALLEIPDFSLFEQRKVSQSTKIFDRTGEVLLYDVHRDVRRTEVPFESINPYVKSATIAIEDDEFYQHIGIKPRAIIRAVLANLQSGEYAQGGSTITQQVIKNALLSKEKTITRKVKEWILAIKLERILTKDQILSLYLNEAPYGGNIYGVEEASLSFFGKRSSEVTLAESAYLAALPQAPTLYSPYGSHRDLLEARKDAILKKMLTLGMITEAEYIGAKKETVQFLAASERGIRAPHFVMYVRELLADEYGEEAIVEDGLRVVTSIDLRLQEIAERTVETYAEENEKQFNAKNAALVALDPRTGEILAMVGSRDYFDTEHDGNFNIALAKRQPGSAFKPIVYAAAFDMGYTPDTVLFDVPTQFSTFCDAVGNPVGGASEEKCYMPENYDHIYRGPISLRNALAQSINVPAVKLLYLVGIDRAIGYAEKLGIKNLTSKDRYGLTLVLGGGEVTLLDMTSAYGVFANDGKRNPPTAILRVEDATGSILKESEPRNDQVIGEGIARSISNVLSDNAARTPAFGAQSYLHFTDRAVAVKTGTTNDYKDAWIIGYTPSLVAGAWAGNNDNTPMEKKVAGFIIAPLWNAFMTEALADTPIEQFSPMPPIDRSIKPALRGVWYGNETYEIDKISGKLATDHTPSEFRVERVIPNPHEILHWVAPGDPTGSVPSNPYADPQYPLWEVPAQNWIMANGIPSAAWAAKPDTYDDVHTPDKQPIVTILNPTSTVEYLIDRKMVVEAMITAPFAIRNVDAFVNGNFLGSTSLPPYSFSFVPQEFPGIGPTNVVMVTATDIAGNKTSASAQFTLSITEGM
ncbi:MAG TPA: transglycosylase domain-containing protein, partial [Candidatus Paceibacterota bacterium]|nr:transglycosylase domain-containing protein [Candidatus Paceibacterota bacterium]